jgi:menaquinone-9 beta-reductase
MSATHLTAENLVIGGGLAGSMLGMRLAAAGREVTLLEREQHARHKVCGEFLSAEAVEYLRSAGVEPLDLGAATIRAVRLASGNRVVEAALPFTALSVSRRALDEALLRRAAERGCKVVRGAPVASLAHHGEGWVARLRGGDAYNARTAFLASGKHDLAGQERSRSRQCKLVGFKMHWRLAEAQTAELRGAMELFLFAGGYGGLSLVEQDAANLCLVVNRKVLQRRGGWTGLLESITAGNRHMRMRLHEAAPSWSRPLAVFPIPYGYLARSSGGLWRVGDQAAVIPSFTGDGMSIALHSGALAAQVVLAGGSADAYHSELNRQLRSGMRLSAWIADAMISAPGRALAPSVLSLLPQAMGWIANFTRIPPRALAECNAR